MKRLFLLTLILCLMAFSIVACAPRDTAPQEPAQPPVEQPPGEIGGSGQDAPPGDVAGEGDVTGEASQIPHAIDGVYANCLQCHADIQTTHQAFGDFSNCMGCHVPAEGEGGAGAGAGAGQ